ncbi:MAG: 3-deoxy-7-phosphoheptulonate synthase [Gammaproteobacteria bacterium]|uniref:3-deoxy-7-phosphoheptulonate synthase n=1 Tax=Rhodoferax sp. TaxID=50421 RepID=UPI0018452AD5|nr:3-deoxy-7-phosphoheptulonate synthase [Rhodoferax sp.]MBU3897346.1 3-deoxy-7-phosphoheptulonate synthase [Gammaproteobacteria bacterium]MBA3058836.1 3-deoxy-7-phosphoheptulonate synthase [Rhodoferax sp.]MBU3999225.1 3-deoxy-7-phosphoheptulonate synthase [Gammaproteobacteria bacterium]MBU4018692.1 3-deoxy-7-phosphoheptulonate synthase [Gammaproteobacteria bacterium]MBU4079647.1 3-deoxy-7-phosphoheptulonate synthase [Gammaproteobacteria bacterium]
MTFPSAFENLNVLSQHTLLSPSQLHDDVPASALATQTVSAARQAVAEILSGRDPRLLVVVGPCSIHDIKAAKDYAQRLKALADELKDQLFIVMRVYFEKPRTTVGWKGLINDPHMDDSFDIEAGLHIARQLLVDLNDMGLPCGTEALDPITPQYLGDLIAWSAIGARTTESQTHRELASGLSSPVGFKNGTDGNLEVALNGMLSAAQPHAFLGINGDGQVALTQTRGNAFGHLILRGGAVPNYDSVAVAQAQNALQAAHLPVNIVIDCSHANSRKNHALQTLVLKDVVHQIADGNQSIKGVMLESNLFEGSQKLGKPQDLRYGVSITDACLGWDSTAASLREAGARLRSVVR